MSRLPHSVAAALRQPRVLLTIALLAMGLSYVVAEAEGTAHFALFAAASALLILIVSLRLAFMSRALRLARAELADDHRRFLGMFMQAPIATALTNDHGQWVRANPALCEMLGYREDELTGRPFSEFTHPDDRADNLTRFQTMRDGDRAHQEFEKRYIARDGREIWALVSVSQISDWQVDTGFHVAQMQDITERKRAERALAQERQLLNAFLESTPDQVYFKDVESRFIRVSRVQAEKLGFASRETAIGRTDFDAFSPVHATKAREDEENIIRSGKPIFNIEERETFHDGREAWVSTTKMALRDERGAIIGTFGISRDVTTRKRAEQALRESEERWRTLLANSQEMVMLVDHNGLLAYASPSVHRWLGYDPDELIGTVLGLTSHVDAEFALASDPDDDAALARAFDDVISGGAAPNHPMSINHRVKAKDGSWHSLESTVVSLRDDPAIDAVLIASRDVTERVALEQQRERLELERRVSLRLEAVGQLAAGIAHEINTPLQFVGDSVTFLREAVDQLLTLMNMYHELLHTQEAIDKEERRRRAVAAEEEADIDYLRERIPSAFTRTVDGIARVTSIVQAMKRFSHPASSDTSPADLNEAIETTLAVCRNEYKYAAEIVLELGDLPPVICNIGEVNQVFLNLIINAAQAIEEKNAGTEELGTIRIATRLDGEEAVVEIADNGPGIPLDLQDRIYEPFFTTKELGKGSGQGLALARATVEHHSGSLECTSAPGEGTTFILRLPLKPRSTEVAQAA